jgi:hypothetical protein
VCRTRRKGWRSAQLVRWLEDLTTRPCVGAAAVHPVDPERVACVMETSSGLLVAGLLQAGFPVSPVNPKTLGQRRNAAGAKTDQIDAFLLARTGRSAFGMLRRFTLPSPLLRELKDLTRDQDQLIHLQTRVVNQLTACLNAAYPVGLTLLGHTAAAGDAAVSATLSHSAGGASRHARGVDRVSADHALLPRRPHRGATALCAPP